MHQIDLTDGAVLEKGCVYVVPLMERLDLPDDLQAVANAKSSTGRLDLLTRTITDGGAEFDRIAPGYTGRSTPKFAPLVFGSCAPRHAPEPDPFSRGASYLRRPALTKLHASDVLVNGDALIDDGLGFLLILSLMALTSSATAPNRIRVSSILTILAIMTPLNTGKKCAAKTVKLSLIPGAFYILVSREAVHIPPAYAAEMAPYLAMVGEFRVHYAGFFDPGFGHEAGGTGSRGVLEVRCHEAPFVLEHGQVVGRLVYEHMSEIPAQLYGSEHCIELPRPRAKTVKAF